MTGWFHRTPRLTASPAARQRMVFLLVVAGLVVPSCAQQQALLDAPLPAGVESRAGTRADTHLFPSMDAHSALPPAAFAILPVRAPAVQSTRLHLDDWALLGAFGTLRFLDYRTTVRCASDPANFREKELPEALVHNRPGLAAFESSTVVANYYVYHLFLLHHHRTLARWGQGINIGTIAWAVGWNEYYLAAYYPHSLQ